MLGSAELVADDVGAGVDDDDEGTGDEGASCEDELVATDVEAVDVSLPG